MKSLKDNYKTHNFITCLKSIKLYDIDISHAYKLHQKNILKYSQSLISISIILKIRTISKQKKYRINNIIKSQSSYTQKKQRILAHKYIQNFTYQYTKQKEGHLEYSTNINTNKQNKMNIIAFTYIYILYKLLNSKNPLYMYYYLIQQKKKL